MIKGRFRLAEFFPAGELQGSRPRRSKLLKRGLCRYVPTKKGQDKTNSNGNSNAIFLCEFVPRSLAIRVHCFGDVDRWARKIPRLSEAVFLML